VRLFKTPFNRRPGNGCSRSPCRLGRFYFFQRARFLCVPHPLLDRSMLARFRGRCDPRRNRIQIDVGAGRQQRFLVQYPVSQSICSDFPKKSPNNTMQGAVCRSGEIGIIDLDTLRGLAAWLAAREPIQVKGDDSCLRSRSELSPPAPIADGNDSACRSLDARDRSEQAARGAADSLADYSRAAQIEHCAHRAHSGLQGGQR